MRTYTIARALATHAELDLLYVRFEAPEPDTAFQSIPGITLHEVAPSRTLRRLSAYAGARLRGVPDGFARGISHELGLGASRLAAAPGRGRVIADGPTAAAALSGLAARRPVIYNSHNFESGFRRELGGSGSHRALRSFERQLLSSASESWMVSQADVANALALCPTACLRYVPNAVDVEAITPCVEPASERTVIYVANFSYFPNRSGLEFLLEEVLPRVWLELPDTRLKLVGAGLKQAGSWDPRVERLGFVDDLAAVYCQARCAVVPLLQGGGTPLKFIEALAYGLPTVATSRAAAGLEVRDGEHCLIADGPEAFSEALIRVLRDGAPELCRRARALARKRYSIQALSELLAS
ncbi:MAG: glycosyltransferase family 4 protein [Solirubrobacteraceae bacterium]